MDAEVYFLVAFPLPKKSAASAFLFFAAQNFSVTAFKFTSLKLLFRWMDLGGELFLAVSLSKIKILGVLTAYTQLQSKASAF